MADTITIDITETGDTITVETKDTASSFTMGQIDHTLIQNIGTNSHATIDTFITDTDARLDILEESPIVIKTASDLPTAVSNVITISDNNKSYRFVGNVSLGSDRIVITGTNCVFLGVNSQYDGITSTTTGDLITVTNVGFTMKSMYCTATSSTGIINSTGTGVEVMFLDRATFTGGTTQITIDDPKLFVSEFCLYQTSTNSIYLSGALESILISKNIFDSLTGTFIDLNSCTADSVAIETNSGTLTASSTFLNIAASGANINSGGEGTITSNKINDNAGGTEIVGYDSFEIAWFVVGNASIVDSDRVEPDGWGYYVDGETSPATQTINTTASKIQIDGGGGTTDESQLPKSIRGISSLWDTTNDTMTPITNGDSYDVRIALEITGKTATPTICTCELDIGGTGTPSIVIVSDDKAVTKTPPYNLIFTFPLFTGTTFLANGGDFFFKVDTGTLTVAERTIYITRTHSGAS